MPFNSGHFKRKFFKNFGWLMPFNSGHSGFAVINMDSNFVPQLENPFK